jgi:putative ABC transport system permease protein
VVQGRDDAPVAVDRPAVTDGTWVRRGGAVVERTFADALGLRVGDTVDVDGHPLRVVGFAVTAARPVYPSVGWHRPGDVGVWSGGLIWVDRADIAMLAGAKPMSYVLNLTLTGTADAFLDEPSRQPLFRGWQVWEPGKVRESNERQYGPARTALVVGSWLLTALAVAGVAGIVAGRIVARRRRVGLFKAVGAGPGMVAAVDLVEYLVLGLLAAGTGLAVGWFAAPALFHESAGYVGSAGVRPPAGTAVAAVTLALAIAGAAALVPVVRAATTSTVEALADAATPPRRRGWRIALSRRLPTALLIGMRINARRPRRARLVTANTFVTMTAIAAVLTGLAQNTHPYLAAEPGQSDILNPRDERTVRAMLLVCAVVCVLAVVNTIVSTWTAVLDARQPIAVARALGATPGQAGAGLAVAQLLPAAPGVVVGIPFGVELFAFLSRPDPEPAPVYWLLAAGLGVLATVAALTAVPALGVARRPVAEALET